jgi:hypothetical protein
MRMLALHLDLRTHDHGALARLDDLRVRSILTKLNLPETGDDHRRMLAVITFLESR